MILSLRKTVKLGRFFGFSESMGKKPMLCHLKGRFVIHPSFSTWKLPPAAQSGGQHVQCRTCQSTGEANWGFCRRDQCCGSLKFQDKMRYVYSMTVLYDMYALNLYVNMKHV